MSFRTPRTLRRRGDPVLRSLDKCRALTLGPIQFNYQKQFYRAFKRCLRNDILRLSYMKQFPNIVGTDGRIIYKDQIDVLMQQGHIFLIPGFSFSCKTGDIFKNNSISGPQKTLEAGPLLTIGEILARHIFTKHQHILKIMCLSILTQRILLTIVTLLLPFFLCADPHISENVRPICHSCLLRHFIIIKTVN